MLARPQTALATALIAVMMLAAASSASAHKTHAKHLRIVHPQMTEPAAGVADANVGMTIHNEGHEVDRLVSAASPAARNAELVGAGSEGIEIPAGGSIKLKSSGQHVRLSGLKKPPVSYEKLPLQLTFQRAGRVDVEILVEENESGLGASSGAKTDRRATEHKH